MEELLRVLAAPRAFYAAAAAAAAEGGGSSCSDSGGGASNASLVARVLAASAQPLRVVSPAELAALEADFGSASAGAGAGGGALAGGPG